MIPPKNPTESQPGDSASARALRGARIAVAATFWLHASIFGTWAARIPAIKQSLDLSDQDLGLALGGLAVGLLIGTRLVGTMERQGRTSRAIKVVLIGQAVALVGPAYAWNLVTLAAALIVLGVLGGALDVLMNVHAVAVERRYGRSIMSGFHGLWSVGSMGSGLLAAVAARTGVAPSLHFGAVAVVAIVLSLPLLNGLLPADLESATAGHRAEHHWAGGPSASVLVVGLLAVMGFGAFMAEGAIADWSAVFLHEGRGASPGLAALGFTVFSAAMAASRVVADRVAAKIGPVLLTRAGALLGVAGYLIFLLVSSPAVALAGFVIAGIGIGPAVPVMFSAAGNTGTANRASILGIAVSAGYLGSVVGPMLIGGLAQYTGLTWALVAPVIFLALLAAAARLVGNAAGGPSPSAQLADRAPVV
ncbi:MAG: MFS transporter [Nocardioidaceae bacterium]